MSGPTGRSRRPRRLSLLLAIGGVVGGTVSAVLGNVTGNLLSELSVAQLGSASAGVIVLGLAAATVVEWRRQRQQAATTDDVEAAPAAGAPTLPWPAGFTGRAGHVEAIIDLLKKEHAVAVVGRRAVGTSACAVQAANLCREDFPDGQYYLDLRRGGRPHSARQVLTALARILGTRPPVSGRADDLADAADELRGQLDGREILVVLDNVDDPAQVRPLLPPTARACRLLLVGTPALDALEGWRPTASPSRTPTTRSSCSPPRAPPPPSPGRTVLIPAPTRPYARSSSCAAGSPARWRSWVGVRRSTAGGTPTCSTRCAAPSTRPRTSTSPPPRRPSW
ncbi:hypothetical protein GA0070606_6423 [Micromonospora citrea]|uniref:NB-ARC domain-containing protein n=1 Tax=Micromonospora citrea TaxID=47855 RepID=A0A1C6W3G2_9ACTN|nr:hypothetical protein GA0070606_6423 [Micromonospora citrea]